MSKNDAPPLERLCPESRIVLDDLAIHREPGRLPLVGSRRTRRFLEVEEAAVRAVQMLQLDPPVSLREAEEQLFREQGDRFDLVQLANVLRERGFVRSVDGEVQELPPLAEARHRWLYSIHPRRLAWLHHPATFAVAGALTLGWLAAVAADPTLRPAPGDVFFVGRPFLVLLSTFAATLLFSYLHELGHFFMARSYGVDSTIRVSHRFYILVLQTDVTNAWLRPARERARIFLAGMLVNLVIASVAGLAAYGIGHSRLHVAAAGVPFLRFIVFLNVVLLTYQLFIFARTDLYHLLCLAAKQRNLAGDSRAYLAYRARRVWRALERVPRQPCGQCGRGTLPGDPFCLRCGHELVVEDPNRTPFAYRGRHMLLAYGVASVLGAAAGYGFFFTTGLRVLVQYWQVSSSFVLASWQTHNLGSLAEGALLVAFSAAQLALTLLFLGGTLVSVARGARAFRAGSLAAARRPLRTVIPIAPEAEASPDAPTAPPAAAAQTEVRP